MRFISALVVVLALGACGSDNEEEDDDGAHSDRTLFSVGGTVQGLRGSQLVLRVVGSDQRILGNGPFVFYRTFPDGTDYEVTVSGQPVEPAQTCTVTRGTGTIDGADVTDIGVACVNDAFIVGGLVAGLEGSGLLLQNNGLDVVAVDENGPFTFALGVEDAGAYDVRVFAQPSDPEQICTVESGAGVVNGGAVTDVAVSCAP